MTPRTYVDGVYHLIESTQSRVFCGMSLIMFIILLETSSWIPASLVEFSIMISVSWRIRHKLVTMEHGAESRTNVYAVQLSTKVFVTIYQGSTDIQGIQRAKESRSPIILCCELVLQSQRLAAFRAFTDSSHS